MWNVFRRNLVEGATKKIPVQDIVQYFSNTYQNTYVGQGIERLSQRMYDKLIRLSEVKDMLITSKKDLQGALESVAKTELSRFETMARTELHYISNASREIEWKIRDPRGTFVYKWGIALDGRTTESCKETKELVEQEAKANNKRGVSLNRLEQIVAFVGSKYFPEFTQRSLNPHYNCRSIPIRVV